MLKYIFATLAVVFVGFGAYYLSGQSQTTTNPNTQTENCPAGEDNEQTLTDGTVVEGVLITHVNTGFTPVCVTVASGTTVVWSNQSDRPIEIGADPHPLHTGNREVSAGEFVLELAPGASAAATVTEPGTTGYHNHINSTFNGRIIVE